MNDLTRQGIPTWLSPELVAGAGAREIDAVAVTLALRALRGRGGLRKARKGATPRRGLCSLPTLMRHLRRVLAPPAPGSPLARENLRR